MYAVVLTVAFTIIFGVFPSFLYWYLKKSHEYFYNAGIPTVEPYSAFISIKNTIWLRKPYASEFTKTYHAFEPHQIVGIYGLNGRSIMIRDPALVKKILLKDFCNFQNHGTTISKEAEPLARYLFNLEGDEWKNVRMKMTGIFTSAKMKMMFPLVKKCAESMETVLMEYVSNPHGVEVNDLCSRFTSDVTGICAFGVDTNSLKNPCTEFRAMGSRIFEYRWRTMLRHVVPKMPNWFIKFFGLELFDKNVMDYFMKLIKDMVKYREENNINRGDFLDLLIAMKNHTDSEKLKDQQEVADLAKFMAQVGEKIIKSDVEMTIELMAAQCFLFLIGGFEGTAFALSLLLYELARHPDVQNKVRDEIKSTIENNEGEVTYDMLRKLPYLNMVLQETNRLHAPNGGVIMRRCNENYKIPDSNIVIRAGTQVIVPLTGLHTDKKYYENPDQFFPEHFTKEAILARPQFTYLPFGEGPRVCIAERFANMQILIGVIYLVRNFSFEVSSKEIVPVEFLPSFGIPPVRGEVWLKCRRL